MKKTGQHPHECGQLEENLYSPIKQTLQIKQTLILIYPLEMPSNHTLSEMPSNSELALHLIQSMT